MAENLLAKYDKVQAAPRNNLLGLIADALGKADAYANKPDKSMPGGVANPPLSMLANMLGVGAIARTADRASYGHDLTQGKGWARQMLPDTKEAVLSLMPGSVAKPGTALGVAGLLGGGAVDGSARAIFAGVKAKTADHAALAAAEKMAAAGADPRKVWAETGWFKGADGKWRFEIDDSKAANTFTAPDMQTMRDINGGEWIKSDDFMRKHWSTPEAARLRMKNTVTSESLTPYSPTVDRAMSHPELFSAYPEAGNIRFAMSNKHPIGEGGYTEAHNAIVLGPNEGKGTDSVLLHELQHAVQSREGFANGGDPGMFDPKKAETARDMLNWRRQVEEYMAKNGLDPKTNADAWMNAENRLVQEYSQLGAMDMLPTREVRAEAMQFKLKDGQPERARLEQIVREYGLDKNVSAPSAMSMYQRLAGEAEARAVQARMNLTPAQRRAMFPLDSYDVPINQLIVRP